MARDDEVDSILFGDLLDDLRGVDAPVADGGHDDAVARGEGPGGEGFEEPGKHGVSSRRVSVQREGAIACLFVIRELFEQCTELGDLLLESGNPTGVVRDALAVHDRGLLDGVGHGLAVVGRIK